MPPEPPAGFCGSCNCACPCTCGCPSCGSAPTSDNTGQQDRITSSAALTGWRKRRAEARLIRLERRLRDLDKHEDWERTFARWGPAQAAKYERDRAALLDSLNGLCSALGAEHVYR